MRKVKSNNETGARHQLLEELFYDFNRNRFQVYWMNFTRGVFFGFGTVLGGTVVVAIIIWILTQVVGWLPFSSEYLQKLIDAMQAAK